jgi:hypothetical protein
MSKTTGAILLVASTVLFILFTVWMLFTPFLDHNVSSFYTVWFPARESGLFFFIFIFVTCATVLFCSLGYILTQGSPGDRHNKND